VLRTPTTKARAMVSSLVNGINDAPMSNPLAAEANRRRCWRSGVVDGVADDPPHASATATSPAAWMRMEKRGL
jgi:hypothetical protein